jgi:hypothetical protein
MKWLFSSLAGIAGLLLLIFGCPLLAVGGGLAYFVTLAPADWPLVPGTITGLAQDESVDTDGFQSLTYCPYVEYTTLEGETLEVLLSECANPPAYEVGDTVEVYYDPSQPRSVQLKGGVRQWVGNISAGVFGGLGGCLSVLGLALIVVAGVLALRRSRAAPNPA